MNHLSIEFQFIGFTPREAFREAANEKVQRLSEIMPNNTSCSARMVMIDNKYFIQVMFVGRTECFIAKEVLDPKKEDTSARSWQAVGLERIIQSLHDQVESWKDTRDQAA